MLENLVIYGVGLYFAGLVLSALIALSRNFFKQAGVVFVLANLIGFLAGATYLWFFSQGEFVLANFNWFFGFAPTLSLLSGLFFTLISLVAALVGVYSLKYLPLYEKTYDKTTVQALTAVFVLGMQGVFLANNAFGFLFFWEVMSISSFFLVMADGSLESVRAAFLYFIMTHLGASAILGGFLILSQGSLVFDLQNITAASGALSPAMLALTFLLFLFGFGSKAGLVPFHVWLPEAHPQAPSNISAMMSGLMLKVAVFGFISVVFKLANLPAWAGLVVITLGLLSGVVGVLYALIEKDLKRIFAYSSIENMGIIFTMLGLALYLLSKNISGETSLVASIIIALGIFHALSHAFFKTALFLSSGVVINMTHSKSLEIMGGIAKVAPVFSFVFLFAILGSLPLAPFGTFYGEWGFIQAIINLFRGTLLGANVSVLLLVVLTLMSLVSGLAIFAMIRVFGISMLGLNRNKHLEVRAEKENTLLIAPIAVLIGALLFLGVFAKPLLNWLAGGLQLNIAATEIVKVGSSFSSAWAFVALAGILLITILVKRMILPRNIEREYHTWDCGQPIDETMEYSATAFSAPIRFFFLRFLGSTKMIKSTLVIETNPWVRKYSFALVITSVWKEKLYQPIAAIFKLLSDRIRIIQGGRVQYYLAFLLATLIISLIIAL